MARAYRMTSARRAAIKKAQRISAQKRRGKKKKRAIGAGIAAAGVIGVTMYAANGYRKRKGLSKPTSGSVNVVSVTTSAEKPYAGSKEIDIIRRDIYSSLVINRDPDTKKINYGLNYRAIGTDVRDNVPMRQWTRQNKQNRNRRGKGKIVSSLVPNKTQKVKRNRPKFNDDRRKNYNSEARAALYQKNAAKIKAKNDAKAAQKRKMKNIKSVLSKKLLGRISIDSLGVPKSGWPLY